MREMCEISAAILAGGLGTRLRSVVADQPKVLAKIGGRPFIAYLLDQLSGARVTQAVLCTGYLGEQVAAELGSSYGSVHITYSQEATPMGTAGALRQALPLMRSDPVLVMNGDSFCAADLNDVWIWHVRHTAAATLVLTEVADTGRYGRVESTPDGKVTGFVEKGNPLGSGWVNAGVYVINKSLLESIPAGRPVSLEREVFPGLVGDGLYGYKHNGRFLDIGTPEAYAAAERFFKVSESE